VDRRGDHVRQRLAFGHHVPGREEVLQEVVRHRIEDQAADNLAPLLIHVSAEETLLDDASRLAYTEILSDEKKETAATFWARQYAAILGSRLVSTVATTRPLKLRRFSSHSCLDRRIPQPRGCNGVSR